MSPKSLYVLALIGLLSTGCATVSPLYVPASNGPLRQFSPAPPAIIRLPVIITLPKTDAFGKDMHEVLQGNLKKGLPDLARWTTAMGAGTALRMMKWNVKGGQLFLSVNMNWLKSLNPSGKAIPTPSSVPVTETQFPIHWNKDWKLEVNSMPLSLETKKISQDIGKALQNAQTRYDDIQAKELNLVLAGFSNLLPKATDIWGLVQNPIYIDKGIWLLINPDSVSTGIINADPQKPYRFNTVLEMTAHPALYFGDHPHEPKKPLPPLQVYQPGRTGFTAISNVDIDFGQADRILNDPKLGIVGKPIPGTGEHKLKVRKLRLYGAAGKIVIETHLDYDPLLVNLSDKPAHMVIYFRGTPRYNVKTQTITMRDLDFDIKTNDFLVQAAEWIIKSDIRKELRHKARIPIGPAMKKLKERMNVVLNCPVGTLGRLKTDVRSFKVLEAFVEKNGINARVDLGGTSELDVNW